MLVAIQREGLHYNLINHPNDVILRLRINNRDITIGVIWDTVMEEVDMIKY